MRSSSHLGIRKEKGFELGIWRAWTAVHCSPLFIYFDMSKFLGKRVFYTCDHEGCQTGNFSWGKNSVEQDEQTFCSQRCADRQILIVEKTALEKRLSDAEFPSPADLRRVGEIRSLLLTDGKTETVTFSASKPSGLYFSPRSMAGFTNRRRR